MAYAARTRRPQAAPHQLAVLVPAERSVDQLDPVHAGDIRGKSLERVGVVAGDQRDRLRGIQREILLQ